jgi:hypothetical protein
MASLIEYKPLLSSVKIAVSILICSELSTRDALLDRAGFAAVADRNIWVFLPGRRAGAYVANVIMQSVVWSQVGQQSPNLLCDLSSVVIFNRSRKIE